MPASAILVTFLVMFAPVSTAQDHWHFTEVAESMGLVSMHGYETRVKGERFLFAGGAAAADVNEDGWLDLFVITGDESPNKLFLNVEGRRFVEVGESAGVGTDPMLATGALFADLNGDGHQDLVVGGFEGSETRVLEGTGTGRFRTVADAGGLADGNNHFSASAADFDHDGDLDLVIGHWDGTGRSIIDLLPDERRLSLWRNDGTGHFSDVSVAAGARSTEPFPYPFTPIFADLDGDGWPDLLVAGDFGSSMILMNQRDGTFARRVEPVISDENGMGAAVGDYDNDGDLDWFVSSIWDPDGEAEGNWGVTGNRLYRNRGDGTFDDVTAQAGVRAGYWGWGSCFGDFDNDGDLDLFHVNGIKGREGVATGDFDEDPSRLFVNNGDGTFDERSADLGLVDHGQGRGVVCFDYDRDGDLDLFVVNNSSRAALFRNDGGSENNYVSIRLDGRAPNRDGIGSRIRLEADGQAQMREVHAGNNYLSSNPAVAHFGLERAESVSRIEITWPDGSLSTFSDLDVNRHYLVSQVRGTIEVETPSEPATRRRLLRRSF